MTSTSHGFNFQIGEVGFANFLLSYTRNLTGSSNFTTHGATTYATSSSYCRRPFITGVIFYSYVIGHYSFCLGSFTNFFLEFKGRFTPSSYWTVFVNGGHTRRTVHSDRYSYYAMSFIYGNGLFYLSDTILSVAFNYSNFIAF